MRLRTDQAAYAGWHRALDLGTLTRKPDEDWSHTFAVPAAEIGDVWAIREDPTNTARRTLGDQHDDWPIVGYALTCPKADCREGVHYWDHAHECRHTARKCGGAGCWGWSGSAADGTLTATPSLHCVAELGGCGWHGWLRNGEMVGA